jgi:hypothetical protein
MRSTNVSFLTILTLAFAAVGFGAMAWVFIAALGPISTAATPNTAAPQLRAAPAAPPQ